MRHSHLPVNKKRKAISSTLTFYFPSQITAQRYEMSAGTQA